MNSPEAFVGISFDRIPGFWEAKKSLTRPGARWSTRTRPFTVTFFSPADAIRGVWHAPRASRNMHARAGPLDIDDLGMKEMFPPGSIPERISVDPFLVVKDLSPFMMGQPANLFDCVGRNLAISDQGFDPEAENGHLGPEVIVRYEICQRNPVEKGHERVFRPANESFDPGERFGKTIRDVAAEAPDVFRKKAVPEESGHPQCFRRLRLVR